MAINLNGWLKKSEKGLETFIEAARQRIGLSRRSRVRAHHLASTAWTGLEPLEGRVLLSTVAWDGGAGDGQWTSVANWAGNQLPGPEDDVVINVAGDITVTYSGETTIIRSLVAHDALVINSGSIIVTDLAPSMNTNPVPAWFTKGLTLSGGDLIADMPDLDVDIRVSGTGGANRTPLTVNSGMLIGTAAVENAALTIADGYTDSIDVVARGSDSTFDGSISSGQTLTLQGTADNFFGPSVLKWQSGLVNDGRIVLDSLTTDSVANLNFLSGTLINQPSGVIEVLPGPSGTSGGISGAGGRAVLGSGVFINQGTVNVDDDTFLIISGVNGPPTWDPITYRADGGTIVGMGLLSHANLEFASDTSSGSQIRLVGFDNRLTDNHIPANTTVIVQGTDSAEGSDVPPDAFGHSELTLTQDTINDGRIVLTAADIDPTSTTGIATANVDFEGHQLTNRGIIDVQAGSAQGRSFKDGPFDNQGTLMIETEFDIFFDVDSPVAATDVDHANSGRIIIDNTRVTFRGRSLTNEPTGVIEATGQLELLQEESSITNQGRLVVGPGIGQLVLNAPELIQTATGSFDVEVGGPQEAGIGFDQLTMTGAVTMDGHVDVALVNGYQPALRQVLPVLVTETIDGEIGSSGDVYTITGDLAIVPAIRRDPTPGDPDRIEIVTTRPGDANLDFRVDAGDLNALALNWQSVTNEWSDADFNHDGLVNAADLNLLALNWQLNATATTSSTASSTVSSTKSSKESYTTNENSKRRSRQGRLKLKRQTASPSATMAREMRYRR